MKNEFREARPGTPLQHAFQTGRQIVVFWTFFLIVVPFALQYLERALGVPTFTFSAQRPIGAVGFAVASALGLWSGMTMAIHGMGTPLPTHCASKLVVTGPYRYVRNPMAIAGLAQGAFVGVTLGSFFTLLYVVSGLFVWNFFVRPIEENDHRQRIGQDFETYCDQVKCWIPRFPVKR